MTHGNAIGHGDGCELTRGSLSRLDALLHHLRLTGQEILQVRFVPGGTPPVAGQSPRRSGPWHANKSDAAPAQGLRLCDGWGFRLINHEAALSGFDP